MKTILYNPIFINPQAYYVFPRLTRYLQPDNESTAEPANYIGTIEVKVIAYGDTTLKRTYTNTDSIDLSEFKNTWIRISLFTKVGSCVLGEWKIGNMESDLPYIDPEVLASLKAVVIVGNKTNNDSDRAIVKNLVDPDNPFVISNAAYTEGSGYADKDSPYYGAFVTDGIDDLITSTKTVQEMLGGSNEITVVSMAHFIKGESNAPEICRINQIRRDTRSIRNSISKIGKSGIFGYTYKNGVTTINNILGDKNDCTAEGNLDGIVAPFSVEGYYYNNNSNPLELCSIAWYWTIIANKVLTTDQINQVIAYFNLDRTLKSDIYCNIAKQGITNENHAEFGDTLIDFSGNGRDIQLNNIAWKGDSGIGKYEVDFTLLNYNNTTSVFTATYKSCSISKIIKDGVGNIFYNWGQTLAAINSTKIQVIGLDEIGVILEFTYLDESGNSATKQYSTDGIYDLPASAAYQGDSHNTNFRFSIRGYIGDCDITITQIPSHAGALLLNGGDDFGKVTGMPVYKDYTVVIDREIFANIGAILSKNNPGAFVEIAGNSVYSFGQATSGLNFISTRSISYLSKYSYCGQSITAGAAEDGTDMWLGTIRDNDSRFFNGAIYSLMTFPYSMSEFLIERQLKKHKLGTLYPNMVEFRPVIKHDDRITAIKYYHIKGSSWINLKPGDYIPVGSKISITTNLKSPYTIANVVSSSLTDIKVVLSAGGGNAYDILGYVTDKSPQKINLTIEQDENYVKFEPVITSNVEYVKLDFYLNNYQKRINIGDYIPKDAYLRANFYLKNNVDELTVFTFNGVNIGYKRSSVDDTAFNINQIYNYDSPQEVNITIDEYIRYEDIVQPYPALLRFKDENGNEVSWGGKFRVGSTITRIGSAADSNLLPNIYNIFGLLLNGNQVTSSKVIVEKTMVFKVKSAYIFDDNEPKCILSPRLLRIPNSSYKILGYIPDISGHGNHGKINNSAYAEGSGVNEDGSYQFDGVDDLITIPTTVGGKQMLMKVNWQSIVGTAILYDQRANGGFAIFNRDFDTNENKVPAYRARNIGGSTYIDGILNKYIYASELKNITHNIVELHDPKLNIGTLNPKIGGSYLNSNYTQMSLYDFMLFDEISTDDKIKQLNEYVGIEGNTEWRKTK